MTAYLRLAVNRACNEVKPWPHKPADAPTALLGDNPPVFKQHDLVISARPDQATDLRGPKQPRMTLRVLRIGGHRRLRAVYTCRCPSTRIARQSDDEFSELADLAVDLDGATVLLGYDVVADRQPQTGPFASGFGREKRLK